MQLLNQLKEENKMERIIEQYNNYRQLTTNEYFYLKYKLEEEEEAKNKFKIDYEKRKNKIDIFEDRLVTLDELLKFT